MSNQTSQELIHNGRKIVISVKGRSAERLPGPAKSRSSARPAAIRVTIDGEPVPVQFDPGTKSYIAVRHSPYMSHSTLTDLAKHVADQVIGKRSA